MNAHWVTRKVNIIRYHCDVSGKHMFSGVMTAIMGEPFGDVDGNDNTMVAAKKTGFYLNK